MTQNKEKTMNKLKSVLVIIMCLMLLGLFVASTCDKVTDSKDNDDGLVGTWKLTEMSVNGISISIAAFGVSMTLVVNADETYSMTMSIGGDEDTETGTWTATSSHLTINPTGGGSETIPYTLDGDQLTLTTIEDWDEDGTDETVELIFTRQ